MENNQNSKDVVFLQLFHHVRCINLSRNYVFNIILQHKLFIIGGPSRLSQNDNIAECFDPSHNQWAPAKAPEIVKYGTDAAVLQGFLYVVGGYNGLFKRISTVQKYNPETNQWQDVSPLSSPRSNVCAVADESYLYAIGGSSSNGPLDIVERFDPRNNT